MPARTSSSGVAQSTAPAPGMMLQFPQQLTAVLMAGSGGSKLYPLNSSGTPKVLLPVANRPLLTFPLRMLEESGVADVLVVRRRRRLPPAAWPCMRAGLPLRRPRWLEPMRGCRNLHGLQ